MYQPPNQSNWQEQPSYPPQSGYLQQPQTPPPGYQSQFQRPTQQYQQQPSFTPPPMAPVPQPKKSRTWLWFVALILTAIIFYSIGAGSHSDTTNTTTTAVATKPPASGSTKTPPKATTPAQHPTPTPQAAHYPPTTLADLHGLAAQGDVNAVHEFHSESAGLTGACPQPKRLVTIDSGITGKTLAEDLLAYFYTQQLDSPCGSIVFAYHNQGEAADGAYTAGRINFDVTDSSGQTNVDPNATSGLTHKLTLDVGGIDSTQESIVTY